MRQLELIGNSFKILEATAGMRKIKGSAIHPVATYHPHEWLKLRKYVEEYLAQAAPTLVGKPLMIDHNTPIPNSKITFAFWNPETSSVDYEAEVPEDIADLIREGKIKGVSVGLDWQQVGGGLLVTPEGTVPYAFTFEELSLCRNIQPGDPMATVQLWEGILPDAETAWYIGKGIENMRNGSTFEDQCKNLDNISLSSEKKVEIRKGWFEWQSRQERAKHETEERQAQTEKTSKSGTSEPRTLAEKVRQKMGW